MTDSQKIVDVMMQCALLIHDAHNGGGGRDGKSMKKWIKSLSQDDVAAWICDQMTQCGIPSERIGSSYAVLTV